MPSTGARDRRKSRSISRRGFLHATLGTTGLLLLSACGGAPSPTAKEAPKTEAPKTEAKPTEAAKPAAPAAQPAATTAPAAKTGAPANLKGTTLSVLQWQSFIP